MHSLTEPTTYFRGMEHGGKAESYNCTSSEQKYLRSYLIDSFKKISIAKSSLQILWRMPFKAIINHQMRYLSRFLLNGFLLSKKSMDHYFKCIDDHSTNYMVSSQVCFHLSWLARSLIAQFFGVNDLFSKLYLKHYSHHKQRLFKKLKKMLCIFVYLAHVQYYLFYKSTAKPCMTLTPSILNLAWLNCTAKTYRLLCKSQVRRLPPSMYSSH